MKLATYNVQRGRGGAGLTPERSGVPTLYLGDNGCLGRMVDNRALWNGNGRAKVVLGR